MCWSSVTSIFPCLIAVNPRHDVVSSGHSSRLPEGSRYQAIPPLVLPLLRTPEEHGAPIGAFPEAV